MGKKSANQYHRRFSGNLFGAVFLLTIVIVLGFLGWRLYPQIYKSHFGQFDRFNLAVAGRQEMLISISPVDKSLTVVKMPDDLYINQLVHGYGQYKISSVYSVGELDHRGGETVMGTIQEYLGLPVDTYYVTDQKFSDVKNFFLTTDFLFKADTNMTIIDKIRFLMNVFNIRFDKVNIIDLGQYSSSLVLADGSTALTLDPLEVDRILQGAVVENQIQTENYRVEVINSTTSVGLGARAVRLLSNIGLSVINVESADDTITDCLILSTENVFKSLTVARIANIYNCKIQKKPIEDRAAITVKLGLKYANFLSQ